MAIGTSSEPNNSSASPKSKANKNKMGATPNTTSDKRRKGKPEHPGHGKTSETEKDEIMTEVPEKTSTTPALSLPGVPDNGSQQTFNAAAKENNE
jgi:hypothetical protein